MDIELEDILEVRIERKEEVHVSSSIEHWKGPESAQGFTFQTVSIKAPKEHTDGKVTIVIKGDRKDFKVVWEGKEKPRP